MQFSQVIVFVSIMIATVTGTPPLYPRACNPGGCVSALAGEFAACGVAASMEGLDPFADAACFSAAVNAEVNISQCTDCF
ncbi:hypothetical protein BU17DRAFT_94778 [Hysterangium stoloniferum]|nr:hypothetical protein BU17DRAFT_94778 [Hysterangium stoloniferum]